MVVAVTGGIGSGKSLVVEEFSKYKNVVTYIADIEAKKIMSCSVEIKEKLIAAFGEFSYQNGKLNREFIASIVFKNPEKLSEINAIVHPAVFKDFSNFIRKNEDRIIIYESALVFETGYSKKFDCIITVTAPLELRISRLMKRDNSTENQIMERIKSQYANEKKILQSNYVIFNSRIEETLTQVRYIYNILTEKS